nr:hypothetical protein [Escherichia coli]
PPTIYPLTTSPNIFPIYPSIIYLPTTSPSTISPIYPPTIYPLATSPIIFLIYPPIIYFKLKASPIYRFKGRF